MTGRGQQLQAAGARGGWIRSGAARRQRSNTAPVGAAGARRGAGQSEAALVVYGTIVELLVVPAIIGIVAFW